MPKKPNNTATPPLKCPKCESEYVDQLRDEQTGELVVAKRKTLVQCDLCKHIFSIPTDQTHLLPAAQTPGTRLTEDHKCSNCGYNLKTLRIGDPCPECGSKITPTTREQQLVRRLLRSRWSGPFGIAAIALFALSLGVSFLLDDEEALAVGVVIVATVSTLYGVFGLCMGEIDHPYGWFGGAATGWRCTVWGIAYILLGVGLGYVSLLIHLGKLT
jgi:predicted Zn-ribbon and HTH transcriptional regulator